MWNIYGIKLQELMKEPIQGQISGLPQERQERIGRIRHEKDRYRCLGAGLLIAYGLCQEGVERSRQIFCRGENGKPVLAEMQGVYFNASHAGDYVVVAVADCEIGIDVECRRKVHGSSVRKCCTGKEQEWLKEQEDRDMAFLRLWTMKESYLKWTGEGLRIPLADIETAVSEGTAGQIFREGGLQPVKLWEYRELPDSHLCVCTGAAAVHRMQAGEVQERCQPEGICWLSWDELKTGIV